MRSEWAQARYSGMVLSPPGFILEALLNLPSEMKTDFLIIGQGIAGTLLSYHLLQLGKKVMVLDNGATDRASHVAAAVINPLSGKKWSRSPEADLFIPEAIACYRGLEALLQLPLLQASPMYIFDTGGEVYPELIRCDDTEYDNLGRFFHRTTTVYRNAATWLVNAQALLGAWKQYLSERHALRRETYVPGLCHISREGIRYKDIEAGQIIFCEGAASISNPLFTGLPFTRNRGEALLLHIPGLPAEAIYHRYLRLVPRGGGLFWYGSNYQWHFDNLDPDPRWREEAMAGLKNWLKIPFQIAGHMVAERPTTAGQIPLVGRHPRHPSIALFNGLGTRGFSAGPFWARELALQLTDQDYQIRNYPADWLASKLG